MATWKKISQNRDNGEAVEMQAPEIISASRSTDIPAFYADWFFFRLKRGYVAWNNPFNGARLYVSFKNTRFIVFWSKNPRPLLPHLDELGDIGCYIQYSVNDYEKENLEPGVPPLAERIDTFKRLVDKLGKGHVVWRFDPLVLADNISIEDILAKIENIGDQLYGYTEKLVFSYADIWSYRKVKANLENDHVSYHELQQQDMVEFARGLSDLNKKWGYELATCGERIDLSTYGIQHNHCIDYDLIVRFAHDDKVLMDFIGAQIKTRKKDIFGEYEPLTANVIELPDSRYAVKDSGQREFCGCMRSKDIGEYNTCIHMCKYCYANATRQTAAKNYRMHLENPIGETITGR